MIVVNPGTRQFNIPGSDLVFGVMADRGSEIKHFQCPRFVGNNLDIASSFVRINYRNANGETDFYLVNNLAIDGDNVTFSWELSPKVTEYKGQVKFVMCVVGPDLKVKWHTTQGTGQVLEGLEPEHSHIEDETADVVAQLISMVEAQTGAVEKVGVDQISAVKDTATTATASAVAEIEAKRANSLATIPNDYTALSKAVDGIARSRAGAVVCEVSGTAIALDDASDMPIQGMRIFGKSTQYGVPTPDDPVEIRRVAEPTVTVYGKNLLNTAITIGNVYGLTRTQNENGTISLNGTATATHGVGLGQLTLPDGEYIVSGGTSDAPLPIWGYSVASQDWVQIVTDYGDGVIFKADSSEHTKYLIQYHISSGKVFSNHVLRPMIRSSACENSDYEQYKAPNAITLSNALQGIPVVDGGNYTDENGQQWICDEIDLERGVYVQRVKTVVADGDEQWDAYSYSNNVRGFSWQYNFGQKMHRSAGLCNQFAVDTSGYAVGDRIWLGVNGSVIYCLSESWYAKGVDAWKAHISTTPLVVAYPLATPVETALSEAELAAYRELHTNKPNTTIFNDSSAYMSVEYAADTKLYIDKKIKEALQ